MVDHDNRDWYLPVCSSNYWAYIYACSRIQSEFIQASADGYSSSSSSDGTIYDSNPLCVERAPMHLLEMPLLFDNLVVQLQAQQPSLLQLHLTVADHLADHFPAPQLRLDVGESALLEERVRRCWEDATWRALHWVVFRSRSGFELESSRTHVDIRESSHLRLHSKYITV